MKPNLEKMRHFLYLSLLLCLACAGPEEPAPAALPEDTPSLEILLDSDIGDADRLEVYDRLARAYRDSDPEKAGGYLFRQLALAERTGSAEHQGRAHYYTGFMLDASGRYGESLGHYLKAVGFFTESGDELFRAKSYNNMGMVFLHAGLYRGGVPHFEKSVALFGKIGDRKRWAIALSNLAECQWRKTEPDFRAAGDSYMKAIELLSQVDGEDHYHAFKWYNDLGISKFKSGDYSEALTYYKKALPHAEQTDSPEEYRVWVYSNIAEARMHMGEAHYAEARDWVDRAMALKDALPTDTDLLVQRLNIWGDMALRQGRHAEAGALFGRAIAAVGPQVLCPPLRETLDLLDRTQRARTAAGEKVALAETWRIRDLEREQDRLRESFESSLDREGLASALALTVEGHRRDLREARLAQERETYSRLFMALLGVLAIAATAYWFIYKRLRKIRVQRDAARQSYGRLEEKVIRYMKTWS